MCVEEYVVRRSAAWPMKTWIKLDIIYPPHTHTKWEKRKGFDVSIIIQAQERTQSKSGSVTILHRGARARAHTHTHTHTHTHEHAESHADTHTHTHTHTETQRLIHILHWHTTPSHTHTCTRTTHPETCTPAPDRGTVSAPVHALPCAGRVTKPVWINVFLSSLRSVSQREEIAWTCTGSSGSGPDR